MENHSPFAVEVYKAILKVTSNNPAPLHAPSFSEKEIQNLSACISSTFVSSTSPYVENFEKLLEEFTGAKYAISTVNGTAALHLALKCAGIGTNDEVLTPAMTFIATANAVTYCNAIPHFVDSESVTLGIDVPKLREYLQKITKIVSGKCINKLTGNIIKAIVPMHTFGHPSNIEDLLEIASDFHLILIEDAAESLGSFYGGRHTGTFGLLGVLSFNGNKTITTGGGGALLTNDRYLASFAKHLSTTAKTKHAWKFVHDQIGFNYRMPGINAAIGCAQMEGLQKKIDLKRILFRKYSEAFSSLRGVSVFHEPPNALSNYWLQTLLLDGEFTGYRDEILELTNRNGLATRPVWELASGQTPYKACPRMNLEGAQRLQMQIINIPSSPDLGNL